MPQIAFMVSFIFHTGNNNTIIEVEDYLDLRFPDNYPHPLHSPFNSILGAKWRITHLEDNSPLWYNTLIFKNKIKNVCLIIYFTTFVVLAI